MRILAHRGIWNNDSEKNTIKSLCNALNTGFGVETDIRDYCGKLVISHDIPDDTVPFFDDFLSLYSKKESQGFIALNIKSDGIHMLLSESLDRYGISEYAVFDMSVPEQVVYKEKSIPFFTRQSEIEINPVMYNDAYGVWMDEWSVNWITKDDIMGHLKNGKIVGIISPEIHGREYDRIWEILYHIEDDNVFLCTDIPKEARDYFGQD